jgi:hypothetical protein
MNLIHNELLSREEAKAKLPLLERMICRTLRGGGLSAERVIAACDRLSKHLGDEEHLPLLVALGMSEQKARYELAYAKMMLSRPYLEKRMEAELGEGCHSAQLFMPYAAAYEVRQEWRPLGTLLHIAAGNVDALPVFSVIEGLLTGNINILKLPGGDDGLSVPLLIELIREEPLLSEYIYVFDFPSEDVSAMQTMEASADAVCVWGGDEAIRAVRSMAHPDTKTIEWGHKISFAYVCSLSVPYAALAGIAYNICDTQQLFCNSCQGIYLDTRSIDDLYAFAERFLSVLDETAADMPTPEDVRLQARKTLELYTEELESFGHKKRVLRTDRCSVVAYPDSTLMPSYMYRNCWVKPLPREDIIEALHPYKNYLQTVALLGEEHDRRVIEERLLKLAVVRVTSGRNMSEGYCGLPHDGEFALRRYMKRISVDYGGRSAKE